MFRKLEVKDEASLRSLIDKDEVNNLQFYEYLSYLTNEDERFGYYGLFNKDELVGSLYFSPFNIGLTVKKFSLIPEFKDIIHRSSSMYLYGKKDILKELGPFHEKGEYHLYHYGYIPKDPALTASEGVAIQATFDDIPAIRSFYKNKEIMIEIDEQIEKYINNGSIFIVKEGGKVVAGALAHSETDKYALIGAVYTDKETIGKGYGSMCLIKLIENLHTKNKKPFLFYDATLPHLVRLYEKLNFRKTEDYWMLY